MSTGQPTKPTYYQPTTPAYPADSYNSAPPTYGTPYPDQVYVTTNQASLNDDEHQCYRLSKTVKIFALIDIFFGCIYFWFNFWFIIPLLIASLGYFGAKNYNSCQVLSYAIYQVVNNLGRLGFAIWAYVSIKQNNQEDQYPNVDAQLTFTVLLVLLGLYIARFSYRLWKAINKLTTDQLVKIVSVDHPVQIMWW